MGSLQSFFFENGLASQYWNMSLFSGGYEPLPLQSHIRPLLFSRRSEASKEVYYLDFGQKIKNSLGYEKQNVSSLLAMRGGLSRLRSVQMEQKAKLFAGIIFGVVIILLLLYAFSPKPYHPPAVPAAVQHVNAPDVWKEFRSPSERFVVSLPTPPQRAIESIPMPSSDERINYDMVLSQAKSGTICMVNIIDYPPSVDVSNAEAVLTTAIKEIVAGHQSNRLVKSDKGTFHGFPGMDFVIVNQDATILGRAILKRSSLFVLSVADHDPQVADTVFKKLADSFVITDKEF